MKMTHLRKGYCDNTDCEYPYNRMLLIHTILTEDFDFDECWWCYECRERDEAMVEL